MNKWNSLTLFFAQMMCRIIKNNNDFNILAKIKLQFLQIDQFSWYIQPKIKYKTVIIIHILLWCAKLIKGIWDFIIHGFTDQFIRVQSCWMYMYLPSYGSTISCLAWSETSCRQWERESTQLSSSWSNITISASALLFWLMKGAMLATVTSLQPSESDFQQLVRSTCANLRCTVREGSHIYTSFDAGQYCCKWFYFCFAHEFPNLDERYSIFVVHVLFK